jgi:predicted ATPase
MFGPCCLAAIFYALTGAPSVGKTSIIHQLEKQGELVVHEAATEWIRQRIESGVQEFWKEEHFIFNILKLQLQREEPFLYKEGRVFVDRGIFDGYAYVVQHNLAGTRTLSLINEALKDLDLEKRYAAIFFILPYNEDFVPTSTAVRRDTTQEARDIHAGLYAVYSRHKHFILVPGNLSPEERAQFILDKTSEIERNP